MIKLANILVITSSIVLGQTQTEACVEVDGSAIGGTPVRLRLSYDTSSASSSTQSSSSFSFSNLEFRVASANYRTPQNQKYITTLTQEPENITNAGEELRVTTSLASTELPEVVLGNLQIRLFRQYGNGGSIRNFPNLTKMPAPPPATPWFWPEPESLPLPFTVTIGSSSLSGYFEGSNFRSCPPQTPFNVTVRAFIPPEVLEGPGVPFQDQVNLLYYTSPISAIRQSALLQASGLMCGSVPRARGLYFGGDNRTFDPNATSYRLETQFAFSPTQNAIVPGSVQSSVGLTSAFASDAVASGALTAKARQDFQLGDCSDLHKTGRASPSGLRVDEGDTPSTVRLTALVGNPLVALTESRIFGAPIQWQLQFLFNAKRTDGRLGVFLFGQHTCYPAFEVYVNNSPLYQFSPQNNSPSNVSYCLGIGLNAPASVPVFKEGVF